MGIYCFSWKELRHYLVEDEKDADSQNDFGKNIIPNMLRDGKKMVAYRFAGYWKDVGTLDSLWDANMDMLARNGGLDVFDSEWPIYARTPRKAPAYLGARAMVSHSVVTQGSIIEGSVENSVVAHSVTVGKGASVRYSVVMPGAVIERRVSGICYSGRGRAYWSGCQGRGTAGERRKTRPLGVLL